MKSVLCTLLIFAFIKAGGQATPSYRPPPLVGMYGYPTIASKDIGERFTGGTAGAFVQARPYIGIDFRVASARSDNKYRVISGSVGPRFMGRFGRVAPSASIEVGAASRTQRLLSTSAASNTQKSSVVAQWTVSAGADLYLFRRIALHIGDLSYSNIHPAGSLTAGLLFGGPGITLRLR